MPSSSRARRLLVVLGGALLLVPASPAAAAGGITSPGAGEVVTADTVVALRAVVDGPAAQPTELTLQAPAAPEAEVVAVQTSPQGGELAYDLDTACASRVCFEPAPARNGTWTIRLQGAATDERTFVVRIAPAVPAGVAAQAADDAVRVRWQQGAEPDLTGYAVEDAAGDLVRGRIGLDACDADGRCSVLVPADAGAWSVRAFRTACPGCGEVLASEPSAPVQAGAPEQALPAAPGAPPAPGSGPPAPAPEAAPQPGPDQGTAFSRAFGTGRAQPATAPRQSTAPAPALPQPDGTFDAELGYAGPEPVVAAARPPAAQVQVQDTVASAVGNGDRLRLAVLSALMIGGAVWLRRWARRTIAD